MTPGRNDACHCGSGKKYKKCCLAKDEEAAQKAAEKAVPPPAAAPPVTPAGMPLPALPIRTPQMETWDARWEEFDEAEYEERIEIFEQTLDDPELPELMDREMAFEMMSQLFEQTIEHNERDRFDSLAAMLRERAPKAYEDEACNMLDWLILNAAARGDGPRMAALTREFAPHIAAHIDVWTWVEGCVAYHGQLGALAETMRAAWPKVRHSSKAVPWAIREFHVHATQYELLDYVATHASPAADDPGLLERLRSYGEDLDFDLLPDALACLTGQFSRQWTREDFRQPASRGRSRQDDAEKGDPAASSGTDNLYKLSLQFVAYAHRVKGVSYSRAELARQGIHQFLASRHEKELERKRTSSGKSRPERPPVLEPTYSLCPDAAQLNRFLDVQLSPLSPQRHFAVALLELLPVWLRFLESQGLLDEAARRKSLSEHAHLAESVHKAVQRFASDPALSPALERWGQEGD